jgi:hypothetical protein
MCPLCTLCTLRELWRRYELFGRVLLLEARTREEVDYLVQRLATGYRCCMNMCWLPRASQWAGATG